MRAVYVLSACLLMAAYCESPTASLCTTTTAEVFLPGTAATGSIDDGDCEDPDGNVGDMYRLVVTAPPPEFKGEVTLESTGFKGALELFAGDITSGHGTLIFHGTGSVLFGEPLRSGPLQVWLPAGTYSMFVTSDDGRQGSYSLTGGPATFDGCGGEIWTTPGVTIVGTVTTDDCKPSASTAWLDRYAMLLSKGRSVTIHLAFPGFIGVVGPSGIVLQQAVTGQDDISFTASTAGEYRIELLAEVERIGHPAPYSMSIQ